MVEEIRPAGRSPSTTLLAVLGLASLAAACGPAPDAAPEAENRVAGRSDSPPPLLQPELLIIEPELAKKKERENLSGAACAGNGLCLMIGDEMPYARFFALSGNRLEPGEALYLLPPSHPDESDESDAEGVAFANGFFYVAGSHSRNKEGAAQASRHHLYRIALGPKAQQPTDLGSISVPSSASVRASLDQVIADHPLLKLHLEEPPSDTMDGKAASHGVNVEGIAVANGRLFSGFRGPVGADGAVILETDADAMFGPTPAPAKSHSVRLGPAMGVRDLAAVRDGLLVLSGPERRQVPPDAQIFLWKIGADPVPLGRLPDQGQDNSAEAITVLAETDLAYRVLVLWDGKSGGLPMIVTVPKRR